MSVCEREGGREGDAHAHGLLIEVVGRGDFAGARGDTYAECVVGGGAGPGCHAVEGCADDGW